jgi:hypothetical protein
MGFDLGDFIGPHGLRQLEAQHVLGAVAIHAPHRCGAGELEMLGGNLEPGPRANGLRYFDAHAFFGEIDAPGDREGGLTPILPRYADGRHVRNASVSPVVLADHHGYEKLPI